MKRRLLLEPVNHSPPLAAVKRSSGLYDLTFDLADVFHHGYIEVHDQPPQAGTNPFLQEYAPLLASDTDLLKWSQGIARGDHKTGESQKLGRVFARAYLSLLGYQWFADIKSLLRTPERNWSVRRPAAGGNMPDWLVSDSAKVAVAEAKGTHSAINSRSKILSKSWRPQVKNVEVLKYGIPQRIKGWIVSTRWVNSEQRKTDPKMYAEDPDVPGQENLESNDISSMSIWLARVHTVRNLLRLGRYQVAQRVAAVGDLRDGVPVAQPWTWRCAAPGLEKISFVGRPIGGFHTLLPWSPIEWRLFRNSFPFRSDQVEWEHWAKVCAVAIDDVFEAMWFDGVALPVVSKLVQDELPPTLAGMEIRPAERPGVSLLADGSLLAPMSLMKPDQQVKI